MRWKVKAMMHKIIAMLPAVSSYAVHYCGQRTFGGLRQVDTTYEHLRAGISIVNYIERAGGAVRGRSFLELGTGWHLGIPIALWLSGAAKVTTIDANPYLKEDFVLKELASIKINSQKIRQLFARHGSETEFRERFDQLMQAPANLQALLELIHTEYVAPIDATCLDLPDGCIDYYVSYNVLEYISPTLLTRTLVEGKRILLPRGLHIHAVDLRDWFAASDPSISTINFLQFNDRQWRFYAGNRYMYNNRMRIDDYINLFESLGLTILLLDTVVDPNALEILEKGFPLAQQFKDKKHDTIATSNAWIVASDTHP